MRKLNPVFYTLAMVLFTLSGFAQEKLIRIDSASISCRQNDLPASFYDKELARLLIPQNTQFGVVRIPSLRCESSLTYDSVNHQLVYIEAATSMIAGTARSMGIAFVGSQMDTQDSGQERKRRNQYGKCGTTKSSSQLRLARCENLHTRHQRRTGADNDKDVDRCCPKCRRQGGLHPGWYDLGILHG